MSIVKGRYKVIAVSHKNNSVKLKNNGGEKWFRVTTDVLPKKGDEIFITYKNDGNRNPEIVNWQITGSQQNSTNGNPSNSYSDSNSNGHNGRHKFVSMAIASLLVVIAEEERERVIEKALQIAKQL